jgi:hypothetical protein
MVEGLSKRISGDWMDIGQAAVSLNDLTDYFSYSSATLVTISGALASSVMQGVVEYKEALLGPLFQNLEDMKYKTVAFEELARQREQTGKLVYIALVQRLFASGSLVPGDGESEPAASSSNGGGDLKLILADVMGRVREEPALKNNLAVKLILTQLAIYQRERETMSKLQPNIKDKDKAAAFRRNFSNTFHKISVNIRKYYSEFLDEERRRSTESRRPSLARFDLRGLMPLFTKQAREFARLRSTLAFALEGKYKVREICVHLFNEKKGFLGLIEQEIEACRKLAGGRVGEGKKNDGQEAGVAFAAELALQIGRQAAREAEAARHGAGGA